MIARSRLAASLDRSSLRLAKRVVSRCVARLRRTTRIASSSGRAISCHRLYAVSDRSTDTKRRRNDGAGAEDLGEYVADAPADQIGRENGVLIGAAGAILVLHARSRQRAGSLPRRAETGLFMSASRPARDALPITRPVGSRSTVHARHRSTTRRKANARASRSTRRRSASRSAKLRAVHEWRGRQQARWQRRDDRERSRSIIAAAPRRHDLHAQACTS